ncbi:hypothetical protein CPB85DRAFT_290278 [Mucidula mucida]|nr:hypothetical protein CPB85DRAFT_290278 [Mucidula mucida]
MLYILISFAIVVCLPAHAAVTACISSKFRPRHVANSHQYQASAYLLSSGSLLNTKVQNLCGASGRQAEAPCQTTLPAGSTLSLVASTASALERSNPTHSVFDT